MQAKWQDFLKLVCYKWENIKMRLFLHTLN